MSGKGSNRRPMTVQHDLFENNWDQAFNSGTGDYVLREVNYDGMWKHSCTVDLTVVWVGKNETCNMCGAWEEDGQ